MRYRVAEHIFEINASADALALLTNYVPFETSEPVTIFSLQVMQDEWQPVEGIQHVFTDQSDDDMPRIEVYRIGEDWLLAMSMYREGEIVCRLRTNSDFSQGWLYASGEQLKFAMDNAAMLLFAFTTAPLNTLEMHASVTVRHDLGYLFLGHSGTGKSTHSRLWMQAFDDAWLLNDDNPVLRFWPAGTAPASADRVPSSILPSPSGEQSGEMPPMVVVYGSPWSGKTPCYKNECARVGGIVKLSQAPQNSMRPLRLPEAYAYMLSSCSGLKIVPQMMDCLYNTISAIIQTVQVYHLDCLPDTAAACLSYSTMQ